VERLHTKVGQRLWLLTFEPCKFALLCADSQPGLLPWRWCWAACCRSFRTPSWWRLHPVRGGWRFAPSAAWPGSSRSTKLQQVAEWRLQTVAASTPCQVEPTSTAVAGVAHTAQWRVCQHWPHPFWGLLRLRHVALPQSQLPLACGQCGPARNRAHPLPLPDFSSFSAFCASCLRWLGRRSYCATQAAARFFTPIQEPL
jgi:hypothetical protein